MLPKEDLEPLTLKGKILTLLIIFGLCYILAQCASPHVFENQFEREFCNEFKTASACQ